MCSVCPSASWVTASPATFSPCGDGHWWWTLSLEDSLLRLRSKGWTQSFVHQVQVLATCPSQSQVAFSNHRTSEPQVKQVQGDSR